MNLKSFFIGSALGSIVYFMLGYVFYQLLFPNIYPSSGEPNILFIYLGCLTFCVLVSYIFVKWAGITDPMSGAKGGAIIGLLYGAGMNLFMYSSMEPNYGNMLTDIIINSVMGAIAGAAIAFIIGKVK